MIVDPYDDDTGFSSVGQIRSKDGLCPLFQNFGIYKGKDASSLSQVHVSLNTILPFCPRRSFSFWIII